MYTIPSYVWAMSILNKYAVFLHCRFNIVKDMRDATVENNVKPVNVNVGL